MATAIQESEQWFVSWKGFHYLQLLNTTYEESELFAKMLTSKECLK